MKEEVAKADLALTPSVKPVEKPGIPSAQKPPINKVASVTRKEAVPAKSPKTSTTPFTPQISGDLTRRFEAAEEQSEDYRRTPYNDRDEAKLSKPQTGLNKKRAVKSEPSKSIEDFNSYCANLKAEFGQNVSSVKTEKSLKRPSYNLQVQILKDESIETTLPDDIDGLKKMFQKVINSYKKADMDSLIIDAGNIDTIKYMSEKLIQNGMKPNLGESAKKTIQEAGFNVDKFIESLKPKPIEPSPNRSGKKRRI